MKRVGDPKALRKKIYLALPEEAEDLAQLPDSILFSLYGADAQQFGAAFPEVIEFIEFINGPLQDRRNLQANRKTVSEFVFKLTRKPTAKTASYSTAITSCKEMHSTGVINGFMKRFNWTRSLNGYDTPLTFVDAASSTVMALSVNKEPDILCALPDEVKNAIQESLKAWDKLKENLKV